MKTGRMPEINILLRYICILYVSVFGIITIIGSGGGDSSGGGDDDWLYPLWVPTDIVISDIDLDSRNDILTLAMYIPNESTKEGHLTVYHHNSQGVFSEQRTYVVGEYPWQLAVDDVDEDNLPDVLITDMEVKSVRLLIQNPNNVGRFLQPMQIAEVMYPYYVTTGDFNSDGVTDIAISDDYINSKHIVLLYQDPFQAGMFLHETDFIIPGTSSSSLATGDMNGDGLDDLVAWIYQESIGYTSKGVIGISLQQPDGYLGPMITLAPQTGLNVGFLGIDDYNLDGLNDLFVFFTPDGTGPSAKFTVILQEADGTFSSPVDTSLADIRGIDDAVVSDFNGDDRPDFAVVGFFPVDSPSEVKSRLNLFIQDGNGSFSLKTIYNMPVSVSCVAAGDINNDGLNDLAVLGVENECMVLIQSITAPGTFNSPEPL